MKRILLVISLWVCAATSCFANTQAENQIIDLLRDIKANGAGGGGGTVTNAGTFPVQVTTAAGAAHQANSQVTATTTAGTLLAARATRRTALIKNTDATITVYIGAATVTSGNGMPLKAGESTVVTAVTLLQVIAASGTPVVAVFDEYD